MRLEELKKNMSVLDQLLDKTSSNIKINTATSETAQCKILKKYRQAFINCLILAIVFCCLWIGNVNPEKLPNMYKAFIAIMCAVASVWYIFLYTRLKKVKISVITPRELLSETTTIKILTLSGEIFFGLALAVLFTLLLSEMLVKNMPVFWLIAGFLTACLIWAIVYTWPRYIKLFQDLDSIK